MPKYFSSATSAPDFPAGSSGGIFRQALSGHADVGLVHEGLYRLPFSPDPQVVFDGAAELLVPALCDDASADIYVGQRLARWQERPPVAEWAPMGNAPTAGPAGRTVTIHAAGLPAESDGWTGDLDFVAALTCSWNGGDEPTGSTVALIRIVARYAAVIVHQGQQAELIRAQEIRIRRWKGAH